MSKSVPPALVYFHYPAACSLGPLVALELAGAQYRLETVDLLGDRTEYRRINPSGKVPALLADGQLLTEGVAIMVFIARTFPEARLLPSEDLAYARQVSFMNWLASTFHVVRRQFRVPARFTRDPAAQSALAADARPMLEACYAELDQRLACDWFGGEHVGVADCYALTFADWAMRDEIDLSHHPRLAEWTARMMSMADVRRGLVRAGSILAVAGEEGQ